MRPEQAAHRPLRQRAISTGMPWPDRIVVDSKILAGKPVVRDTRLPVEFILELLASGPSETDVIRNHPGLTRDDARACPSYASDLAHEYKGYPLPG